MTHEPGACFLDTVGSENVEKPVEKGILANYC